MEIIKIRDEYIRLGQLLKLAGMCSSGVDAKRYKSTIRPNCSGEKSSETEI